METVKIDCYILFSEKQAAKTGLIMQENISNDILVESLRNEHLDKTI